MPHYTTPYYWWLLLVLLLPLQQLLEARQTNQEVAEDCFEYCLHCPGSPYQSLPAPVGETVAVSLQVNSQQELPVAHITVPYSVPATYVMVSEQNVTLWVGEDQKTLTLTSPRPAFSWVTLVLSRPAHDALLLFTPEDRLTILHASVSLGPFLRVSSNKRTRVVFNCLAGCFVRNESSGLVGDEENRPELNPPFTMYLKPSPPSPPTPPSPSTTTIAPFLTLSDGNGSEALVNGSDWAVGRWYRVKVLVGGETTRVEMMKKDVEERKKEEVEEVEEVAVWVPDGSYHISTLKGFTWTLHCPPKGLTAPPDPQQPKSKGTRKKPPPNTNTINTNTNSNSTQTVEPRGTEEGGKGTGGRKPKQKHTRGGAGAGEVVAWVLAGLALFMVMVLAFALCTRTARPTHEDNLHDFPPSVGVLSFKDVCTREPEENSEPGTPTLTVPPSLPHYPRKYPNPKKAVEG